MNVFHGNYLNIWNEEYRCYNSDVAEPIIMLNFRMPTDLNDRLGTYELASQESANFSGLYRVVEVENSFDDGKFTQTLRLVRFNNQGVIISSPGTSLFSTDGFDNTERANKLALEPELTIVASDTLNNFSNLSSNIFTFSPILTQVVMIDSIES